MTVLEDVVGLLRTMKGVIEIFPVDGEAMEELNEIESKIKATLDLDVKNTGVEECLNRQHVICIIKDDKFRPPPEPTVLLVGDDGLIMGKEIIPSDDTNYHEDDNAVFLSEDFIVYKNVKPKEREYFLMPPVSFPELEALEGIFNVVSCSPSPLGDFTLRKSHGMNDDPHMASILVGFDEKD
jgi:hypothetical protein